MKSAVAEVASCMADVLNGVIEGATGVTRVDNYAGRLAG